LSIAWSSRTSKALSRAVVVVFLGAAFVAFVAQMAGCGGVGNVGVGASRSSVQPVRGAYGTSGSSGVTSTEESDKRAQTLAKENRKPAKQETAVCKTIKALPDGSSDSVAEVTTPPKPGPSEDVKLALREADRGGSGYASGTRTAYGRGTYSRSSGGYDDYENY